ncbi:MAG: hypothetical protein AB7S75_00745 [Desulfococcaceae bacterium]
MSIASQETIHSEHSEAIRQIWAMFHETDRKFHETSREMSEGYREMREGYKELRKLFKETDDRFKETDKRIGEIAGKWGRFVEGLIVPGMISLFEKRGIEIEKISQRVRVRKQGDEMEIDILGINGEYAVPVEVKSTLSPEDVKEFIEKLKKFKKFFPEYAERKIVGAVAGIVMESDADKFAYRQGLFVIVQKGETVKIINDKKFTPKIF